MFKKVLTIILLFTILTLMFVNQAGAWNLFNNTPTTVEDFYQKDPLAKERISSAILGAYAESSYRMRMTFFSIFLTGSISSLIPMSSIENSYGLIFSGVFALSSLLCLIPSDWEIEYDKHIKNDKKAELILSELSKKTSNGRILASVVLMALGVGGGIAISALASEGPDDQQSTITGLGIFYGLFSIGAGITMILLPREPFEVIDLYNKKASKEVSQIKISPDIAYKIKRDGNITRNQNYQLSAGLKIML